MSKRPKIRWVCTAAITTAMIASSASAVQLWGVRGVSSLGDIRDPAGGQSNFSFDFAGGAAAPSAEVMIDDAVTPDSSGNGPWDRGTTHGLGVLTFGSNQPADLKAEVILTGNLSSVFRFGSFPDGAVGLAGMFASDLFQYTGPTATTLSLTFTLDGVLSDPLSDPNNIAIANVLTFIDSNVAVFADTPNYDFVEDVGTLVAELGATLKQHTDPDDPNNVVDAVDQSTLNIDDDTGGLTETLQTTLMFDVVPGETFYVHQTLATNAAYGTRLADAFSTLSSEFDQPQFVTSLSVPEPASVLLLVLATVGFATGHVTRFRGRRAGPM